MKVKLLTTISFFTYQIGISQTEKLLHGKVVTGIFALKNVEVINKTALTSTRTNESGEFAILVKPKDSLLFFSKDYLFKRFKIANKDISDDYLLVNMIPKPEELEEVVITNVKLAPVTITQQQIDEIKLTKDTQSLQRYTGVYDGTITNGVNFVRMGTGILNFLKKDKEKPKPEAPKIDFKLMIAKTIPVDFFRKNLKLNLEEENLFLEFCNADPKSKILLEHPNVLTTMDFLYAKHEEFKKLK